MTSPPSLADIERAAAAISDAVVRTPTAVSQTLSEILGCEVVLKFETLQFTASFKERGARNRLLGLSPAEREAGVVAVSAGNHAQAVARHASQLGIPATIVMPTDTPFIKVSRTRHLGATVELAGSDFAAAMERGLELVDEGRILIHPFDDAAVIAGQGTVALEMLSDAGELDAIVVPVGGGGLIAGMATVIEQRSPRTRLFGVQTETFPGVGHALAGQEPPRGGSTLAEGIAVPVPGALTLPVIERAVEEVLVVEEAAIEEAIALVVEIEKVVVEGAGAAGIAALASNRDRFAGQHVGVVLTGANIDPRHLAAVIQRGLVRSGRLARIRVGLEDRPGTLAGLLEVIAGAGANLLEVLHQRLFADVPLRQAEVDLVVECMDSTHRDAVIEAIAEAGYLVRPLPLDAVG